MARVILAHPRWGVVGTLAFLGASVTGTYGVFTGALWGDLVAGLQRGEDPAGVSVLLAAVAAGLLAVRGVGVLAVPDLVDVGHAAAAAGRAPRADRAVPAGPHAGR